MKEAIEEIVKLFEVLRIERDEEIKQHQAIIKSTPIDERKEAGVTWYPVVVESQEIGLGGKLILKLKKTTDLGANHKFSNGQTASFFLNTKEKPNVTGILTRIRDNSVELVLQDDEVPEWIDDGKMGLDLIYNEASYKEMEKALQRVAHAEKERLAELRNIILGYEKAKFADYPFDLKEPELNESQNLAIARIHLAEDVAIVHGPPGTGKTTTLVKAIEVTLKNDRQLLACAPSNTAVDWLTKKLIEKGIKVVRIGHPARVNEDLLDHTLEVKVQKHSEYKRLKDLRREAIKVKEKAKKYKRTFSPEDRIARKEGLAEARALRYEARDLERFIIGNVLDNAQVITSTMVGSARGVIKDRSFDTVFLDEAAQALEPASWIPITKAHRVVFAGDHCQLPPTVKSYEAQRKGLLKTLFEKCIERTDFAVMLATQYRMNEKIMSFSSEQFYSGELNAHDSVKDIVLGNGECDFILESAIEFVDTAGCGFEEEVNPQSLSTGNPSEANLLFKHLSLMLDLFQIQEPENKSLSIGLISPYREQVKLIKREMMNFESLTDWKKNITIHTVDGFQGQERDVIYISLVRSNTKGEIGFLKDIRRMNVAMTRAKKKLVIIGDSATIANNKFYQAFLDYIEKVGAYKSAWEYLY